MELLEKEWFIEAPWGKLCIVAWGNCLDPPVLLCHGENDTLASFRPLLRLLPKNFYYLGFELPGHGKSDRFPPGLMISALDLVFSVEVVRRHYQWQKFVYMSHSYGGYIGRLYSVCYPGRMSKVIELENIAPRLAVAPEKFPEWYDRYFTQHFARYDQLNAPKETGPKYTWEQAIAKVSKIRGLSAEDARATIERFSEPAGDGLIRFTFDQRTKRMHPPPFSREQIHKLFTAITTPTLAVVADKSIERGLYRDAPFLLEESGNYRVRKVEGTHDVHIISPDIVAPYVSQFLLYGLDGLDGKAKL